MSVPEIKLSIAIVTRNRPDSLRSTLISLLDQSYRPYEIIISDDSSEELSMKANLELASEFGCRYVKGPQRGLYANRNFVAQQCLGTHIRTMDDDHLFPEDHLQRCIESIISKPNTILTIGEYIADHDSAHAQPYPKPGQVHPRGYSFYPRELDSNGYYGISCGATIYPVKVIEDHVLNAEFYKFGILYLEYGARLNYLGYKIEVLNETYIIHNDAQTTASNLSPSILIEATIFTILCLSFIYQPTLKNKLLTTAQISRLILFGKANLQNLKGAYKNSLEMKKLLKVGSYG